MIENLIHCNNLCYQIDQHQILSNINYKIPTDQLQIILGANGVGKSTLLKVLAGLLTKTSGDLHRQKTLNISYLGHQSQLYMDLTVSQNLNFINDFFNLSLDQENLFLKWGLLEQTDLLLRQLSQGQLKRLSLLVALATPANLYLLDEPSSNLDRQGQELLMKELLLLRRTSKASIVLITHELGDYFEFADQVFHLATNSFQLIYNKNEKAEDLNSISNRYFNLLRS